MTMRRLLLLGVLISTCLSGCASESARENLEHQLDSMTGKIASEALQGVSNLDCGEKNLEYGCMYVSKSDCRIWFSVDRRSERITGWQYAGQRMDCWRGGHGY